MSDRARGWKTKRNGIEQNYNFPKRKGTKRKNSNEQIKTGKALHKIKRNEKKIKSETKRN